MRERLAISAVLVLAFVFVVAVVRSILRHAETTYNYPSYSSLNNSSEGTRAYFEALRRLGYQTSQNYLPLHKLIGTRAAVFYAGPSLAGFRYAEPGDFDDLEKLANRGARVILAFDPSGMLVTEPKPKNASKKQTREDLLKKRWGVDLGFAEGRLSKRMRELMAQLNSKLGSWHFSSWSTQWTASEIRDGHPLFLERSFGSGSILLIADATRFTNRELLLHPDTEVLAAAAGGRRKVIFDESHLGIEETGTVIGLARAHRLEWMLLGFVVVAALYVWRNSISFVPRLPVRGDETVLGHDAHSALSNLLMQSIPQSSILRFAAEEWNRSAIRQQRSAREIAPAELNRLSEIQPDGVPGEYKALAERVRVRGTR